MPDKNYNTIIVGGGIIGSSIFFELSKSLGNKVLLVEAKKVGTAGATGKTGAIIRAFDPVPEVMELAVNSIDVFKNFKKHTGVDNSFFHHDLAYRTAVESNKIERLIEKYRFETDDISVRDADYFKTRFNFPENSLIIHDKGAGYVDPQKTCRSYALAGCIHGGVLLEGTRVISLLNTDGYCQGVKTNKGDFFADKVIFAGGAEGIGILDELFPELSNMLRNKRIQYLLTTIEPINKSHVTPPIVLDDISEFYMKPIGKNKALMGKVIDEWDLDLENISPFSNHDKKQIVDFFKQQLPQIKSIDVDTKVVGYDLYTPSKQGVIELSSIASNCLFVSGFSGQGFKLAPEISKAASKVSMAI